MPVSPCHSFRCLFRVTLKRISATEMSGDFSSGPAEGRAGIEMQKKRETGAFSDSYAFNWQEKVFNKVCLNISFPNMYF